MKGLCLTREKSANKFEYNFFQELLSIMCIVAGDINLLWKHYCATVNTLYTVELGYNVKKGTEYFMSLYECYNRVV